MNFSLLINLWQTVASFQTMDFVLWNHAIGGDV
jgi:hypothetical protein